MNKVGEAVERRLKSLARTFVERTGMHVEQVVRGPPPSVWAYVQPVDNLSYLRTHVHPTSTLVGTLYSAPLGDSHFVMLDPRTEWTRRYNAVSLHPKAGLSTIFPPWIPHQVAQAKGNGELRISFAMNYESNSRAGKHPWTHTACSAEDCDVGQPYDWATSFMKRQLWDKPRQQRFQACRDADDASNSSLVSH